MCMGTLRGNISAPFTEAEGAAAHSGPEWFLQVGRSDVVNLQHVCAIRNYRVLMKNGVELSVSRSKYAAVRAAYLEWKGQFGDE